MHTAKTDDFRNEATFDLYHLLICGFLNRFVFINFGLFVNGNILVIER